MEQTFKDFQKCRCYKNRHRYSWPGGDPQITFITNRDYSVGQDISENSLKFENSVVGSSDRLIITDGGFVGIGLGKQR